MNWWLIWVVRIMRRKNNQRLLIKQVRGRGIQTGKKWSVDLASIRRGSRFH